MSAIDQLFDRLRQSGRKAFMPFVTAGDPDLEFTADVLRLLVDRGSDMCELGIPYSDPIADGPVIQASYTRSLGRQIKLAEILQTVGRLTPELTAPIVTMVSYSIVYRRGLEAYVAEAKAAGVAGAIVPDLPVEESGPLAEICRREDFSLIQLITPLTPRDRALRIAERTTGFIYYVSVTGITGERTDLPPETIAAVAELGEHTDTPVCVGFGISNPQTVESVCKVADGAIVGSAIIHRITDAMGNKLPREQLVEKVGAFISNLLKPIAQG